MSEGSEYALGSNYARVLNISTFRVCQVSAYARIAEGSEYAWSRFHRVLNKPMVLNIQWPQNMASLWICTCYTEWWICLNKLDYALIVPQHVSVCLSNAEYDWICRHITEKNKELNINVSDGVHSIRSLYKLLSSYRDRDIFRALPNI